MQATVSITQVYQPGPGKTNWAIVGSDGARYSVKPEFAQILQQGASVAVDYEVKSFNGKDVRMANRVSAMTHSGGTASAANHTASPSRSNGHDTKSKEMAVMGIVGRAMGSGQFNAGDVKLLMAAAAQAWDEVFG